MKKVEQARRKLTLATILLASLFFLIGMAGIILPILPGWPFIFAGLFIIGGTALLDRAFLKYLPDKYRRAIIDKLNKNKK